MAAPKTRPVFPSLRLQNDFMPAVETVEGSNDESAIFISSLFVFRG